MPETFTTSTGVELILKPISPLLAGKVRTSVIWPEKPTYQAKTVSGEIEEHPHDETTLETDEDKAAWLKYLLATAQAEGELNERISKMLFKRGIDYKTLKLPKNESWIAEQEDMGITVPDDPLQRKMHYVETELLASKEEIKSLILRLMAMSGVDEEVIAAAERSFRGEVEGEAAGEPEDLEGPVELRDELPESEGGEGMGEEH